MASTQQVPKRATHEQEARQMFIEELRGNDVKMRLGAMSALFAYLDRTTNPPAVDPRFFPILRYTHRENAIEGRPPSELDLRYFPVLRWQQRMETLRSFVPQLIERLGDSDPQIRTSAAYLLGQIGAREALPQLRRLGQSDPDPQVRTIASAAIEAIGPARGR
jgi:HEAT repeat protein